MQGIERWLEVICRFGFPTIWVYHAFVGSVFLNVAADDARGLEKIGNTLLSPFHYVFCGRVAHPLVGQPLEWEFSQRFIYGENFWVHLAMSVVELPQSLFWGSIVKGSSFLGGYLERHLSMQKSLTLPIALSHQEMYTQMGLPLEGSGKELFSPLGYERREGDEFFLQEEKEALQEIAHLLNQAGIVWWIDCGTLLGAYRYGGVIPWDLDLDIGVLLPDFDNVYRVLQRLDSEKYEVQDWSGRERSKSYLKVCVKSTRALIDIYHFEIDEESRTLRYILSLENNIFLTEDWRVRERRFKAPVAWDTVFPLKRAVFDGIDVFVPQNPKLYLQRYYGDDLSPVKLWNLETGCYEKDESHPYWQRACVH